MGKLASTSPTTDDSQWDLLFKIAEKLDTSGGVGGGPATIADGADVAEGATSDAAATAGGAGTVSAKLRLITSQLAGSLITKDNGPNWTSVHGVSGVPFTSADATTAASVTDAPTAGQKLVITDLFLSNNSGVSIQFTLQEETTTTVIAGPFALAAGTSQQFTPRSKAWKLATADKKLQVDASAAGNIMVDAHYYSEA